MHMKSKLFTLLAGTLLSCGGTAAERSMQIASESIMPDATIPQKFTMYGDNISPELHWAWIPPGTEALIVSCIDIHPIARHWIHWLVINLPPSIDSLAEDISGGNLPEGAIELKNSFGKPGYGGPRPPAGTGFHEYVFTVYALKSPLTGLDSRDFIPAEKLQEMLKDKLLAKASFSAKYRK